MPKANLPTKSSPKGSPSTDTTNELVQLRAKLAKLEKQSSIKALPCFVESFVVSDDGSYVIKGSFAGTEVFGDLWKSGKGQWLCDPDQKVRQQMNGSFVSDKGFGFILRPALIDAK